MRTAIVLAFAAAACWLSVAPTAWPQALPVGPDFAVGGDPDLTHWPRAAIDDERWFVVVFATYFATVPEACGFSDTAVFQGCQPLDEYGVTWWSERPIDVAVIDVDNFVAVWETVSWLPNVEESFLKARRLSAHATLITDPFVVASSQLEHPRDPRIAVLDSSRLAVVWVDDSSNGTDDSGSSIQAGYFTHDGTPLGARFQVNTTTTGDQTAPDVAAAPDGGFVVTWQSESSSGSDEMGTSIQLRRFDPSGLSIGNDQQVNTYTTSDQTQPRVASGDDGGLVVVWESDGSSGDDDSSLSIQARLFDAEGTPIGPDIQVNSYVEGTQDDPAVAVMGGGGFEVVWASDVSPGDDDSYGSIQQQAFDRDGGAVGSQRQVNTTTLLSQWDPDIAMTAEGDFVVVWRDLIDAVRGRIFRLPMLADGFESGDTSAWSATVP